MRHVIRYHTREGIWWWPTTDHSAICKCGWSSVPYGWKVQAQWVAAGHRWRARWRAWWRRWGWA